MPLHPNGSAYFTEAQKAFAYGETSTLKYVQAQGLPLKKEGSYYRSAADSRLVFAPNGMWFDNGRDLKGGAVKYQTVIEGKSYVEAILHLNGERWPPEAFMSYEERNARGNEPSQHKTTSAPTTPPPTVNKEIFKQEAYERPLLVMPKADEKSGIVYSYLHYNRGIDYGILTEQIQTGNIYQSSTIVKDGAEKKIPTNVVFCYKDKEGENQGGFRRGTIRQQDGTEFKGEITGTNKEGYCFRLLGKEDATKLCIFEAAIDALSHATMEKMDGKDYKDCHRIAIGGNGVLTSVKRFLEDYPEVTEVDLCMDNDEAGYKGASKMGEYLTEKGYDVELQVSKCKDWNEDLQLLREALATEKLVGRQAMLNHVKGESLSSEKTQPQGLSAPPIIEMNVSSPLQLTLYELGYGHLGNGLTVWNRLEEQHGNYKTIANIAPNRSTTFLEKHLPKEIQEQILHIAKTSDMTISATQNAPVFHAVAEEQAAEIFGTAPEFSEEYGAADFEECVDQSLDESLDESIEENTEEELCR